MRDWINIINEAARIPLPGVGERPWWVNLLAPLTTELETEWSDHDWTWTAGGCFAFAENLKKAYGGQLWALSRLCDYGDGQKDWGADHAVVFVNGHYYDFNGVFDPVSFKAMLDADDAKRGEGPFERKMLPKHQAGWFEDEFLDDEQWAGLLRVLRTGKPYTTQK
jgi:hypothetical protein